MFVRRQILRRLCPRSNGQNYAGAAARVLIADAPHLARADFHNLDYAALVEAVGVNEGDVWYIDPPYAGTTGYAGTPKFDHTRFWTWAAWTPQSVRVLVSEFTAPCGWAPIWSVKRKLESRGKGCAIIERVDQVFTLASQGDRETQARRCRLPRARSMHRLVGVLGGAVDALAESPRARPRPWGSARESRSQAHRDPDLAVESGRDPV